MKRFVEVALVSAVIAATGHRASAAAPPTDPEPTREVEFTAWAMENGVTINRLSCDVTAGEGDVCFVLSGFTVTAYIPTPDGTGWQVYATPATSTPANAATTTTAASAQPTRVSGNLGLSWPGSALEQPVFEVDGISSRIDAIVWVDPTARGDLSLGCQSKIDFEAEYYGTEPATQCIYVAWSFDVAAEFQDEEGYLTPGSMLTPEGLQIDQGTTTSGLPGAQNRTIDAYYVGGTPGSTLTFRTGSNSVGWTEHALSLIHISEPTRPY